MHKQYMRNRPTKEQTETVLSSTEVKKMEWKITQDEFYGHKNNIICNGMITKTLFWAI